MATLTALAVMAVSLIVQGAMPTIKSMSMTAKMA